MYSIRSRLLVGMLGLLAFIVAQAVITYYYVTGNERLVAQVITRDYGGSEEITRIAVAAQMIRRFEKEYLIYLGDPEKKKKYHDAWSDLHRKLGEMVGAITSNKSGNWSAAEIEESRRWQQALAAYGEGFEAVAADIDVGRLRDVREANEAVGPAKDKFRVLLDGVAKTSEDKYQAAQSAEIEIKNNSRILNRVLGVIAVGGILLAGALAMFLPAAIARPIKVLAASAHEMSTGNLIRPVVHTGASEFRDLSDTLERMRISQKILIDRLKSGSST